MSEKRRDSRNRILHDGEYQREDGRYRYRYTNEKGEEKNVYSWKLVKTDKAPNGKRSGLSLREKEEQIKADLRDSISEDGKTYTVTKLVEKYISLKVNVKYNTMVGYNTVLHTIQKDPFGSQKITEICMSDVKEWLIRLQNVDGKGPGSIRLIKNVLKPAFKMAMEDNLIRKNPFDFDLSSVMMSKIGTREALTKEQEEDFLNFVEEDSGFSRYYDAIYILFNTGLRISEFCGLTMDDVDFKKLRIKVDHQLLRTKDMKYYISEPKTKKGIRYIPMTEEVAKCFRNVLKNRTKPHEETVVDGYTNFIFLTKFGTPTLALNWQGAFDRIFYKMQNTTTIQMPKVTPHVCRHTFCSNMAKAGMNPKILQYIMGHSSISMTLDIYTHAQFSDAEKEMQRISEM